MISVSYRYPFLAITIIAMILFFLTFKWTNIKFYLESVGIAWLISWIIFAILSYIIIHLMRK